MSIQTAKFIVTGLHVREQWSFLSLFSPDLAPQATQTSVAISDKLKITLHTLDWEESESAAFEEALGVVLLMDGRLKAQIPQLPHILGQIAKRRALPTIVAVRGDYEIATLTALRQQLNERQQDEVKIFPCPDDSQASQNVLLALIYQILGS